jgi:DNA primase
MTKSHYDKIAEHCNYLLYNYPKAQECLDYLNTRLSEETQKKFMFGYYPSLAELPVLLSAISEEELVENKLLGSVDVEGHIEVYKKYYSFFNNHPLIVPTRDLYGNIIALTGRSLKSDDERSKQNISKYKNTHFIKSHHVFGLYEAKESIVQKNFVYVVEGQFDVIKSHEKGITNIVAMGTSSMSMEQFCLLLRYTDKIFIMFDNDAAGLAGRKKIMAAFGNYAKIRNVFIPDPYKDIDEFFQKNELKDLCLRTEL